MSGVSVFQCVTTSIAVASPIAPICQVTPCLNADRNRCDMLSTRDALRAAIVARRFIAVSASDRMSPASTDFARNMAVESSPLLGGFARVAGHIADEFNVVFVASTVRNSVVIRNSTLPPTPYPVYPSAGLGLQLDMV